MPYVIYTEEEGVYLGSCMGLGFWSKLDAVDQPSAPTFPSAAIAEEYMAGWDNGRPPAAVVVPVEPDQADGYASIAACVRAGLPEWLVSDSETANDRPI